MRRLAVARFLLGLVCLFAVVVAGVGVVVPLVASAVPGWRTVVITSGSMAPRLRENDLVIVTEPDGRLDAGVVATFVDPQRGGLVTHRVQGVDDDGRYITRGDANPTADSVHRLPTDVVGVGTIRVPFAGLPRRWMDDGRWGAVVAFVTVGAAAAWASRYAIRREFDPWARVPQPLTPVTAGAGPVTRRDTGVGSHC